MNSARLRQRLSSVYASDTASGSREFQASSALRAFSAAVSAVKGGSGGRGAIAVLLMVNPSVMHFSGPICISRRGWERLKLRSMKIAKPLLLVSTPLGMVTGLIEAYR